MNTADITLTIFILWIFGSLHTFSHLMLHMNRVKNNCPKYRCKPSIMPFANIFGYDTVDNFTWCIQHIGSMIAGSSLESTSLGLGSVTSSLGSAGTGLGTIADSIGSIKSNSKNNTGSTFSIFGNITVQAKRFFNTLKDTMHKVSFGSSTTTNLAKTTVSGGKKGFDTVMHAISKVP